MEQPETVAIPIRPFSAEEKVRSAARSGDTDTLYQLIGEDVDVLRRINETEFVDTPLHMASAAGHTDFAMEMMYLKPSFATKLNKDGLSPLHLALQNGHTRLVLSLLRVNESLVSVQGKVKGSLVSVKGKMGYTPFHYLVMKETDRDLLTKFLNRYPHSINDVTGREETALHVAASSNNLTALKILLRWLGKTPHCSMIQKQRILNSENWEGETVMHVAVSKAKPDPEIVRLLKNLRINSEAQNSKGLTALDILNGRTRTQEDGIQIMKCVHILRHDRCLDVVRKIRWLFLQLVSQWGYEIKNMSADRGNALLVVTVLILTATYQSTLSPPGGVLQANSVPNNNKFSSFQIYFGSKNTSHVVEKIEFKSNNTAGSSVLSTKTFLWFFIPNMVAFSSSFLLTCFVLPTLVSGFFSFVIMLSLSTLLFCLLDSALLIVSPNDESSKILFCCVYFLVYITYLAIAPIVIPKIRRYFQ